MDISRQADYAVRTVLELALHTDRERVAAGEIARRQGIPAPFLAKIVARLATADIVTTQRGVKGGIRLTHPANQTTLLAVIEAIDGPITLNRCVHSPKDCSRNRTCMVHPVWVKISSDLRHQLSLIHFADLAEKVNGQVVAISTDLRTNATPPTRSRLARL